MNVEVQPLNKSNFEKAKSNKIFHFFSRVVDATTKSFPEFNLDDFKSSCLNSDKDATATAKKVNEVLLPASMSMPAIASSKPTPQLKYVIFFIYFMR